MFQIAIWSSYVNWNTDIKDLDFHL